MHANNTRANNEHLNILEVKSLQDFIKNIIQNKKTLTDYISTEKPEVQDENKRLRYRLHSPVKLDIYDESGNHTGLVKYENELWLLEEQIPNSYYMEFGETKYAGTGNYLENIILTGEDVGTFTFDIDQMAGDQVSNTTTFSNIPVGKNMRATLAVSENIGEMKIDADNDGQIDAIICPGEEVKKGDLLGIFEKILASLSIDGTVKDRLINKVDNAKKQAEKGNLTSFRAMLENVKQQINVFSDEKTPEKFRIPQDEAEKLIEIIRVIMD